MSGPIKSGTISASQTVELGEAASGRVSSWLVHLDADGSWTGSCQPVGSAVGSSLAYVNIAYKDMTSGAIGTTPLSTDGLVLIDSAGTVVSLIFNRSAGTMQYYAVPIVG